MKRSVSIVSAVAVGAAAMWVLAMSVGNASPGPATRATTTDITYKEGVCSSKGAACKTIKAGKTQFGFGSRLDFIIPISSGGSRIGHESGECVYLPPKTGTSYCNYQIVFSGKGSISVQGVLPATSGKAGTIPITGGTRTFEGAYGTLTLRKGFPAIYDAHILTP
jgi:allene oxide cyclase-like protein